MESLYILTKQAFTSLYRFGQVPITQHRIINDRSETLEILIIDSFKSLPYFAGDEEYIIIKFDANQLINVNGILLLEIENVSEIIPLTDTAKNSFQMKFNSNLEFSSARFESIIKQVEDGNKIREMSEGAKAFWSLCKTSQSFEGLLSNDLLKKVYNYRVNSIKPEKVDDFYIHLMVYDRYEIFPKTDLGFFYDVGELFAHSVGHKTFKGSKFYKFLEKNKVELTNKGIIDVSKYICNSPDVDEFKNRLISEKLHKYVAAAMFLKFKEDLKDKDTINGSDTGKLIGRVRKSYKEFTQELDLAVYMTGAFFGYDKFYDDLYNSKGLKIFKKQDNYTFTDLSSTHENNTVTENEKSEKTDLSITKQENTNNEKILESTKPNDKKSETEIFDSRKDKKYSEEHTTHIVPVDKQEETEDANTDLSSDQNTNLELKNSIDKLFQDGNNRLEIKKSVLSSIKEILKSVPSKNPANKKEIQEIINSTLKSYFFVENQKNSYFLEKLIS